MSFAVRFIIVVVMVLIGFTNCRRIISTGISLHSPSVANSSENQKDNHGCDAVVSSCGNKGACCDVHDACYKAHGCTAASWFLLWGNCANCNQAVMRCVAFRNPGKSTCCSAGNCGQPRP